MKSELDICSWNRKEHFEFFSKFEEPFFGLALELDCTHAYENCKKEGISFFLYYLYLSTKSVNSIEPFRYMISGEKIYIYDKINVSATISRSDNTFGFPILFMMKILLHFERTLKRKWIEYKLVAD